MFDSNSHDNIQPDHKGGVSIQYRLANPGKMIKTGREFITKKGTILVEFQMIASIPSLKKGEYIVVPKINLKNILLIVSSFGLLFQDFYLLNSLRILILVPLFAV